MLIVITLISLGFFVIDAKPQSIKKEIPVVTVCQLNEFPYRFDGKVVKVSATFEATFEGQSLVDNSCRSKENSVEFDYHGLSDRESINNQLGKNIKGNSFDGEFVNVVVVGKVEVRKFRQANSHNVIFNVIRVEKTSPIE